MPSNVFEDSDSDINALDNTEDIVKIKKWENEKLHEFRGTYITIISYSSVHDKQVLSFISNFPNLFFPLSIFFLFSGKFESVKKDI
jgi:hypothetical protein